MPQLRKLTLFGCNEQIDLAFLSSVTALRVLNIKGFPLLTNTDGIHHCTGLRSLELHAVNVASTGFLNSLCSLKYLTLCISKSVAILAFDTYCLPPLRSLCLRGMDGFSDVDCFLGISTLRDLALDRTSVTDHSVVQLATMPSLKRVCLKYCKNVFNIEPMTARGIEVGSYGSGTGFRSATGDYSSPDDDDGDDDSNPNDQFN